MSVAFDTLSASEEFQKAGMSHDQAKVQVSTIAKVLGSFSTQSDIKEAETNLSNKIDSEVQGLKTEIKEVETRLENKIDSVKSELESRIDSVENKIDSEVKALRSEIREVEARLENKIEKLGLQLTIRLGAMMAMAIGLVAAMIKLL